MNRYRTLIDQLSRRGQFRIHPGLDRITTVLQELGQPQSSLKTIHIAGTNGKGSVAACLESILRQAGYRTALYTSPHLKDVRERIQISGHPLAESLFLETAHRILDAEKKTDQTLTYFEFLTALAFCVFKDHAVDIAIIEVGLGGRWDATNVLEHPELSLITSIGLDHTQWLGKTETAIAREKAGIIKSGVPLISGVRGPAQKVIETVAQAQNAPLLQLDRDFQAVTEGTDWNTQQHQLTYSISGLEQPLSLALLGNFQTDNAALAFTSVGVLRQKGWKIQDAAVQKGFSEVRWPGRCQWGTYRKRTVFLDGAHNPPAMDQLLRTLSHSPWKAAPKTFVFGAYRDKDVKALLKRICPEAAHLVICTLPGSRGLSAKNISALLPARHHAVELVREPLRAFERACDSAEENALVVVTGSLSLVGLFLDTIRPVTPLKNSAPVSELQTCTP